jgi:hypothetical protein
LPRRDGPREVMHRTDRVFDRLKLIRLDDPELVARV